MSASEHILADPSASAASGCPFSQAQPTAPNGCPVSSKAQAFDPFEGDYQVDPADALRWSREQEPVFFAPKIGYWVVSRYDDVKAVFRDNQTFSPCIALEKMTPASEEAMEVLKKYDYGMSRTLVNEDEPVHMGRRRALLQAFTPEELAKHEPMVRRLTQECIDRFIDSGRVDLVDAMLWEIPLTVALHFLGVPEDDMDTLRTFSVAHTVNTWGRPSPEQQVQVAEAVGRFWQFSGQVLEKMKAEPDGEGWMHYSIRQHNEMPDIVPESYLHSMMMAIIVAAHETTALATANALKLLLTERQAWEDICDNPALIPNAVEECLRLAGSVVAWRRQATTETELGGVTLPKDAKLLIVSASANHDGAHFNDADTLDIYRDNTTDHLTFGYGSHQCLGKNLGRMEMRIFVEELTRRLPHLRLVEDQEFTYLPNTSFRGPDALWVEWEPERNPERKDTAVRDDCRDFTIGAPSKQDIERPLVVTNMRTDGNGIQRILLQHPAGQPLPPWTPGAHIVLIAGEYERMYSLCGDPDDTYAYELAVLKEEQGRGGSKYIHEQLKAGSRVGMRGPNNHFKLDLSADHYRLIAGGIGITPILAMADELKARGKSYEIHYAGRSVKGMACLDRLRRDHDRVLRTYAGDAGQRMNIDAIVSALPSGGQIYSCGPERMISALEACCESLPAGSLHYEQFSAVDHTLNPDDEQAFELDLKDSGLQLSVPADKTMLQVLQAAGIDVQSDCNEGLCGSCEVQVTEGEIDHRDQVLSASERAEGDRMMSCCSRAKNGNKLTLAL